MAVLLALACQADAAAHLLARCASCNERSLLASTQYCARCLQKAYLSYVGMLGLPKLTAHTA